MPDLIHVCYFRLASLTALRELSLHNAVDMLPGDVGGLSALTNLTLLELRGDEHVRVVRDPEVAMLAGSLKQLRRLDVSGNGMSSMACLASIAQQLTQLTALCINGNPGVTAQGVMALTRLTRLQQLDVDRSAEVTDELLSQFWRGVKSGR